MWLKRTRTVECCEYYAALVTNIIAISTVTDCIQYYPDNYVECCPLEIEGRQLEQCNFHLHAVKSVRWSFYYTLHHTPRLQHIRDLSRSAVDSLSCANTVQYGSSERDYYMRSIVHCPVYSGFRGQKINSGKWKVLTARTSTKHKFVQKFVGNFDWKMRISSDVKNLYELP